MFTHRASHTLTRFSAFAAASAALLSLSSCHWGNYEVDPPGPGAIQGNYETQIDSQITICATKTVTGTTASTQTNCANIAPSSLIAGSSAYYLFNQTDSSLENQTMSDPVFLAFDSSSGLFALEPPGNTNPDFYWIVESDNAGDLQNPGTSYAPFSHLMPDTQPNCDFNMQYEASGTYGQPSGPFTTGTTLPLSGRIAMSFDVLLSPNGTNCGQLEACYNSASGCDADDNAIVQAEFGTAIKAGVMAVTDIPNLQDVEYRVSYQ